MDHENQLQDYVQQVEQGILQLLPSTDTRPSQLHSAMTYSLKAGGKRLRPVLLMATSELFGNRIDALPAAVAVECLHTYTLIHDDLPCMDDSDLRRGKPSCHKQFDEATAVLAGDALLTHAFQILGTAYEATPNTAAKLVVILSNAAGSQHLIGGQMEDIMNEGGNADPETLEYIHKNKTAALLTASLHMGAVLGGANITQIEKILQLGECLGITFQIVDDLLDQSSNVADLGKPIQSDTANKKTTYLSVHGTENAQQRVKSLKQQATSLCEEIAGTDSFLEWLSHKMAMRSN